jgi:hypothetical protein
VPSTPRAAHTARHHNPGPSAPQAGDPVHRQSRHPDPRRAGAGTAAGPARTPPPAAPGLARRALAAPGLARRALAAPGLARRALAAPGLARRALAAPGLARRAPAAPGLARRALVRCASASTCRPTQGRPERRHCRNRAWESTGPTPAPVSLSRAYRAMHRSARLRPGTRSRGPHVCPDAHRGQLLIRPWHEVRPSRRAGRIDYPAVVPVLPGAWSGIPAAHAGQVSGPAS